MCIAKHIWQFFGRRIEKKNEKERNRYIHKEYGPLQFTGAATAIHAPQIYKPRRRKE